VCCDLVDLGRLKILANYGVGSNDEICYAPRNDSFCSHSIQGTGKIFIVNDTLSDERFKNHWLVTGPTKVRFYAAANLIVEGQRVSTSQYACLVGSS